MTERTHTTALACAFLILSACARPGDRPVPSRDSLAEPRGAIDPTSIEAAGQVVQRFGALIEQRRFEEAEQWWTNAEVARRFTGELATHSETHLEIGGLSAPEGAAGSVYTTMPVRFYGRLASGAAFSRKAKVTLRRTNDVPGATEAQRRWRIDTIAWSDA